MVITQTPGRMQQVDPRWGSIIHTIGKVEPRIGFYFLDPLGGLGSQLPDRVQLPCYLGLRAQRSCLLRFLGPYSSLTVWYLDSLVKVKDHRPKHFETYAEGIVVYSDALIPNKGVTAG